jgi:prepilin-type N-terminal cleavage/methylation domain-containing protein
MDKNKLGGGLRMILNNKSTINQVSGFTIVELLIVIIIIGILATITIVAYQGVTARANTAKAQTNAVTVQKKAEAYNADIAGGNGYYPPTATAFAGFSSTTLGALPSTIAVQVATPTSGNGTTNVKYIACASVANNVAATGYFITYYNFTTGSSTSVWGGTSTSAACAAGLNASTS